MSQPDGIVPELPESLVARVAHQAAHRTCRMIVVDIELPAGCRRAAAQGASPALGR
jgi:hypothetical protein